MKHRVQGCPIDRASRTTGPVGVEPHQALQKAPERKAPAHGGGKSLPASAPMHQSHVT